MRHTILLFLYWVILSVSAAAELGSVSDAIAKARELNILTQQLPANYIMVGMKNYFGDTRAKLKEEIEKYKENIAYLDAFATSKKAFQNIEAVSDSWEKISKILEEKIDKKHAAKLIKEMNSMLQLTRETTRIYTSQTGSSLGKVIDASANLAVVSQKMALLYLLKSWEVPDVEVTEEMQASIASFRSSVDLLEATKTNTPETLEILKAVERDFIYFTVMGNQPAGTIPTLIYKKSNNLLQRAKKLSALYSKTIILN